MHAVIFIRHQAPIFTIAFILSLATILCSVVSYAPRVVSAFTSRSSKQLLPLCSTRTSTSTSANGRRSLTAVTAAPSSYYSSSSERTGSRFFPRQPARRMSAISLSATGDVNSDTSLASFLKSTPETLPESIKSSDDGNGGISIQMIMGNEAGDADSIVSALGLGYVNSLADGGDTDNLLVQIVPIVSVARADISLRRDVVLLFDLAGIDIQSLLYIDDDIIANKLLPPSQQSSTTSNTLQEASSLTLVDHNRIRSSMSHLSSLVSEIVDHHEDEKSHNDVTIDSGKRNIAFENGHATVASTCTLVAERLFDQMKQVGGGGNNNIIIDGSLGLMLLGVILLDSVNMLPAAGKGTPRDQEAMDMLLKYTHWESIASTTPSLVDKQTFDKLFPSGQTNEPDKTALFEVLSGAKNDPKFWSDLSVTDCLRIDYKKFIVPDNHQQQQSPLVSSIGLSSVLMEMDSFLAKDSFLEELEAFATSSDVGLFGVLTLKFEDGKANRELLLAGSDAGIVESFANHLLNHSDAAFLEVSERNDCMSDHHNSALPIRVFRQGNGKGSRKQVAPILLGHASDVSKL